MIYRESTNSKINSILTNLKEYNNVSNNSEMVKLVDEASKLCDSINSNIDGTIKSLEIVNILKPNKIIEELINSLKNLQEKVNGEKNKLTELKNKISTSNNNKQNINQVVESILLLNDEINKNMKNTSNIFIIKQL